MPDFFEMIRAANGREAALEFVVEACARRGGFDDYLPAQMPNSRTVERGRRGHADVEILNPDGRAVLGIEVKVTSQVNWGRYGNETPRTQFDEMAKHLEKLVIITSANRAERDSWPDGAVVLTRDDLAGIAADVGLTAEDVVAVGLGYAA